MLDAGCIGTLTEEASKDMRERRKARRYDLFLPVTIEASTSNDFRSLNGETLDISTRGVYLTVDNELRVGMTLGLTMRVPKKVGGGTGSPFRRRSRLCRGHV